MSELILKNFMKTDNIDEVYRKENGDFIYNQVSYTRYQIPKIQVEYGDEPLYYMQKGDKEYFAICEENLNIVLVLQEELVNNEIEITNSYMLLRPLENTILDTFFQPSIEQLKAFMENRVPELLARLPYSVDELKAYREMINKYTERVIKTQVEPTVYTEEALKELTKAFIKTNKTENKQFVRGQENWYKGKCYKTVREVANDLNLGYDTLQRRLAKGMTLAEAIETPVAKRGRGARK